MWYFQHLERVLGLLQYFWKVKIILNLSLKSVKVCKQKHYFLQLQAPFIQCDHWTARPQPNRLQDTSMERRLIASLLVADADKPK